MHEKILSKKDVIKGWAKYFCVQKCHQDLRD